MDQIGSSAPARAKPLRIPGLAIGGALASGLLASACCLGPLVLAALGIGGAGLFAAVDSYRPVFTVVTFGLLGAGFWSAYRRPKTAAGEECGCEQASTLGRAMLWIAALVAVGFWAYPYLAEHLLG